MVNRSNAFVLVALMLGMHFPAICAPQSRTPLIQSVDIQIPVSPTPVRIAGKNHLAYELQLRNFMRIDVVVTRLEVSDADRRIPLAGYSDSELAALAGRRDSDAKVPDRLLIAGGTHAVLYLWVALDEANATPARLRHKIEFDLMRQSGREQGVVETESPEIRLDPPVVLNAPLRGGPWVAVYDPAMPHGHRTSIYTIHGKGRIPARFAIDWIRLDDNAMHTKGDESKLANWLGYGAEVLAVADGVVADAKDDIPEYELISASQKPVPLENASGNYVTLNLGNQQYAFYEHLKHGSIKVKPGEQIKSGQVIGMLGNSGSSSSGPHLHFHVSDANSILAAEGMPYVFKNFEVLGAFQTIDAVLRGERWEPPPKNAEGTRRMELPAANVVILFPAN